MKAGQGQVVVFAGTVFGEGAPQSPPFWERPSWKVLARRLLLE